MSDEFKRIQLKDLAPESWFASRQDSTFVIRIYTCIGIPFDQVPILQVQLGGIPKPEEKLLIILAVFGGLKHRQGQPFLYFSQDGIPVLGVNSTSNELPQSSYSIILAPKKIDGKDQPEGSLKHQLDFNVGILRAQFGSNFMRELVFEAECKAGTDEYTVVSKPIRLPKIWEGPYISKQKWIEAGEIRKALSSQKAEKSSRLKLGLEILRQAGDNEEQFFHYWSALEIVCNGTAQAIRYKLKAVLKLRSFKDVDETGFGSLANWRHEFFHKGIRPPMSAEIERLFQVMFLDALREELGLTPLQHTLELIHSKGFNLHKKSDGISNQIRTKEIQVNE